LVEIEVLTNAFVFGKKITWSKPSDWDGAFLVNLEY